MCLAAEKWGLGNHQRKQGLSCPHSETHKAHNGKVSSSNGPVVNWKRIQYQLVDISQDNAVRDEMQVLVGNPKAAPPHIVNGDHYCGDFELFVEAVEQNMLQEFLKLA
ncbi:hypothetical protein H8959_009755 [Pygathrix nigripes]